MIRIFVSADNKKLVVRIDLVYQFQLGEKTDADAVTPGLHHGNYFSADVDALSLELGGNFFLRVASGISQPFKVVSESLILFYFSRH